jgi:alkylation response protein AidB-like acyl-CoA dehydrogenase
MAVRIFVGESMSFRTIGYLDEALALTSWESETGGADKMKAVDEYAMEASMSKVWGSEALFATADDAVQAFGGAGFSAEYPAEKIYRDCRINRIFEGTNEINRLLIAQTFLKRCSGIDGLPLAGSGGAPVDLPQDNLLRTVALAKARALKVIAQAQADHGPKILENQEAAARISNMLLEIYATESAVVRAQKMADAGHRWASLARDMAEVYAQEAWNRVQGEARMLAAELASGEALDALVAELLVMHAPAPVALSSLRQRIAQALVDQGRYPIAAV